MTRRTLGLLVLPYGHDAFSPYFAKVTYRCMVGESVGDSSAGQLMSDANLCLTFKAANMTLCVSYSTP